MPCPQTFKNRRGSNLNFLRSNPRHPSLRFRKVGEVWSARVSSNYRALADTIDGGYYWFWIGSHADYDKQIG